MKTNREGLTWTAWKNAAGVSTSAAKRGWTAGEDPSDWRAARVQTYPRMPTRAHAVKYRRDPVKNRLFIGVFPTGISYADRGREVHGDYARCAFLDFSTLSLHFEKGCPTELRAAIKKDAKKIQAKRGETFQVSASGQTVLLGSRRDPVKKKHLESATMAQLRRPTPRFQHAKGKGHKKFTYEVISLDVWGNENDGFEVNQAFRTGRFITVQVREAIYNISPTGRTGGQHSSYYPSDRAILAELVRGGFLNRGVTTKDVEIDGEAEHELYLQDKKTGEPVFHLQFKGRTL